METLDDRRRWRAERDHWVMMFTVLAAARGERVTMVFSSEAVAREQLPRYVAYSQDLLARMRNARPADPR